MSKIDTHILVFLLGGCCVAAIFSAFLFGEQLGITESVKQAVVALFDVRTYAENF